MVFCILVAISYNKIAAKKPEEVAPFKKFIDAGDVVMGRVVSYVISFTPYAVLSLIARAVSRSSPADLVPLLSVLVLAYVLCAIQAFVVEARSSRSSASWILSSSSRESGPPALSPSLLRAVLALSLSRSTS